MKCSRRRLLALPLGGLAAAVKGAEGAPAWEDGTPLNEEEIRQCTADNQTIETHPPIKTGSHFGMTREEMKAMLKECIKRADSRVPDGYHCFTFAK